MISGQWFQRKISWEWNNNRTKWVRISKLIRACEPNLYKWSRDKPKKINTKCKANLCRGLREVKMKIICLNCKNRSKVPKLNKWKVPGNITLIMVPSIPSLTFILQRHKYQHANTNEISNLSESPLLVYDSIGNKAYSHLFA